MDETEKKIRRRLRDDFPHYSSRCLKVRTKSGDITPLILNKAQGYIHAQVEQQRLATGKVRAIILKGRQQGCSTYIEGRLYWRVTHRFGVRAFILTHDADATNNLFDMAKRYHEHCPSLVRPSVEASNSKELIFAGLDSGYKLGTAGNKAVGRSSTVQLLHSSEVAYQPNAAEHAKGIMQTVPNDPGTEIFLESTANGIGNYFHEQWQLAESGESEFLPIFIPWYWQDEYTRTADVPLVATPDEEELTRLYGLTAGQLQWRRLKITELSVGGIDGQKAFCQEYPNNATEAFQLTGEDSFIKPSIVMAARKGLAEPYGGLILGVDPARFGDDRSSIIRRKGRVAYGLESYRKKDTMELVGIVVQIINNEKPDKVCIDIGGLGAGVFDRLAELGHRDIIVAVNAGSTPLNQKRYFNKRAEMWGTLLEWLMDNPNQIPDNDTLHADLCNVRYSFDSNSRLKIEKKEDMKKRGIRSPDEADALCLTFALPDIATLNTRQKQEASVARDLAASFSRLDNMKKRAYGG